ncbi:MAG: GNAT family N-acetyltransferase [Cellulosilyticaceae bacterium]
MNPVIYRPIRKSDYDSIKAIISEAFGFHKWIDNPSFLDAVLSLYLHNCMSKSTFNRVAIKNGEVIGVILGSIPEICPKKITRHHNLACLPHLMKLAFLPKAERKKASTFRQIDKIYEELISGKESHFQGSIDLFAVSEKARGLGLGKALMSQLLDYMHSHEVRDLYLYTDTICNYGFYESQGWRRLASQQMQLPTHHEVTMPSILDVFLYSYRLTASS